MKFGKIIIDAESEDLNSLIGKKVAAANSYYDINHADMIAVGTFVKVGIGSSRPFNVNVSLDDHNNGISKFAFIREIMSEDPIYTSYHNVGDLISDFKKRFDISTPYYIPIIWIRNKKTKHVSIIESFYSDSIKSDDSIINLTDLFRDYEYIDGSIIGKIQEK